MTRQTIKVARGLNIPIGGVAAGEVTDGAEVSRVALLGSDYRGLKPSMEVAEGDRVSLGQPLFTDKKNPGVQFTAPGAGKVLEINRGARRALRSVVIELSGDSEMTFEHFAAGDLAGLPRQTIVENLLRSGLWTALRTRPFGKVASPEGTPDAVFVNIMDTNPLAGSLDWLLAEQADAFVHGLTIVSKLTEGFCFVCCAPGATVPGEAERIAQVVEFAGPHPAGLVGTHIHFLHPVGPGREVWYLGLQDVIAIGKLFTSGKLAPERIVTLGGPMAARPRQLRTRAGASIRELLDGELKSGSCRVVSGSILNGHRASGWSAYLGRYHSQVTLLPEESPREFAVYMRPGFNQYSASKAYASSLLSKARFRLTTSLHGSRRAMVPIGNFEKIMPLDLLPAPLLKSLIVEDTDTAQALGCLELEEEDLALCSFVCPSKYEYGRHLRDTLTLIEKEG
ncbi:MAG: Na(+)-translocating NADH-quinone reductase subunit A [Xanthomonadales bacterium]|nr:Na(+)-translocating NADH-quinone reductase subunit A [Xanthomonadales bacterium]